MRALLVVTAAVFTALPVHAYNTAQAAAVGEGPGITATVGAPQLGMGGRLPWGDTGLRAVWGASYQPGLRAPQLDLGVGYRRTVWRFFGVDVTPTLGLLAPTFPKAALMARASVVGRGMLSWRWLRLWTGPTANALFQMTPSPAAELGLAQAAGISGRWLWFELGAHASLGARAFWVHKPTPAPEGWRPDAVFMLTLDVGKPWRPTRADMPWML